MKKKTFKSKNLIVGPALPNIPWQERPEGCDDVVWRHSANPITKWNPIPGGARIFNSAVMPYKGEFIGVMRVDYRNGFPHLHVAHSQDGLQWKVDHDPIVWQDEEGKPAFNKGSTYDPRLCKIGNTYYITWCDYFPGPSIGLARTKDFKTFVKMENPLMPCNRNGVLFPRKINGEYVLLSRPSDNGMTPFGDIHMSHSKDLNYWGKHRLVMRTSGNGWWQGVKVGAGPVPIETTEGWLLFYHGVTKTCNGFVYSMGATLLDLDHPEKVIYRTRDYLLTPEETYETVGYVPNVVFPCAALTDPATGRIAIYYGAADTYTAVAYTQVDELLDYMKKTSIGA